jgi:hypothetical protein
MSFQPEARGKAPALLSIGQAAVSARVHRDDIDAAMRNGRLRYVRHEGRRMVSSTALGEWLLWTHTGNGDRRNGP